MLPNIICLPGGGGGTQILWSTRVWRKKKCEKDFFSGPLMDVFHASVRFWPEIMLQEQMLQEQLLQEHSHGAWKIWGDTKFNMLSEHYTAPEHICYMLLEHCAYAPRAYLLYAPEALCIQICSWNIFDLEYYSRLFMLQEHAPGANVPVAAAPGA